MKKYLTSILFLAVLSPVVANAQSAAQGQTSTVQGQSIASIAPGAVNITSNGAQQLPWTAVDQHIHTNQAASAAPAFGVQGIGCVKPGKGFTLQVPGAGGSMALTGEMDEACEAPRDINTMNMSGGFSQEDKQRRACAVPAIAKASPKLCKALTEPAAAPAPVAQRPMPWQAGG